MKHHIFLRVTKEHGSITAEYDIDGPDMSAGLVGLRSTAKHLLNEAPIFFQVDGRDITGATLGEQLAAAEQMFPPTFPPPGREEGAALRVPGLRGGWRVSIQPRLRSIETAQRQGERWPEFGYHLDTPGLAVTQTERFGVVWWTLTHLLTGYSLGIIVAEKERAARLGAALRDIDWRRSKYPPETVAHMHARVAEVAEGDGLKRWTQTTGVEFLDPDLARLVREEARARLVQLAAEAAASKETETWQA